MFNLPLFNPALAAAYNLVTALAGWLAPVTGSLGTTLAIVVFTAAVRLLMHPLTRSQVRAEKARAALAPQQKKLQDRYRRDRARQYQEIANLYRKNGVSQTAGLLPALVQLPVLGIVYQLFISRTVAGSPNRLLAHSLGGVPLGSRLTTVLGGSHVALGPIAVFAVLLLVLAAIATWSSMGARAAAAAQPAGMGRLISILPYGTVAVAAFVPLATGVYLATTTLWTVTERALLTRGLA